MVEYEHKYSCVGNAYKLLKKIYSIRGVKRCCSNTTTGDMEFLRDLLYKKKTGITVKGKLESELDSWNIEIKVSGKSAKHFGKICGKLEGVLSDLKAY